MWIDLIVIFPIKTNAEDLGHATRYASELSLSLGVNVLVYEYPGYGATKGKPSEKRCYQAITAAYNFLRAKGINEKDMILLGRSVGSGPTLWLASKLEGTRASLGGIVLVGSFASIVRVLFWSKKTLRIDIFPNIDRIQMIQAPVLIVHGGLDRTVPPAHGGALLKKVQNPLHPLLLLNAEHNDLEKYDWEVLMSRIRQMVEEIK